MPVDPTSAAERPLRRARYLIPQDLPRRAEILAALGVLLVLAHLLLAPAALLLAACCHAVSRISRWRPQWLLVPAATGVAWVLVIGPAAALAGAVAGPRALAALAAGLATGHASGAPVAAGLRRWLPGQLPAAFILAAAEAAAAWWLSWLHTSTWDRPPARPGLVANGRRLLGTAQIRAGGVLTRDGVVLGVDTQTGRRVTVPWPEAAGGVLVTGSSWANVSAAGFQFVHAAIRRRKPVIAVDLAGDPAFAASVTAACAAADAPLQVFGAGGPGYYEPLLGGTPARKAALISGMIEWGERPEAARRECGAVLTDIFAVAAAAPAGPGTPVLDDVIRLLDPAALRARLERLPAYHPRRDALAGRVRAAAARLAADPEPAAMLAGRLSALRASALGRWLSPGPPGGQPGARITLGAVARDRGVALFSLGESAPGGTAGMIATLVALDAAGVFGDLHRAGSAMDGLAWIGRCEAASPAAVSGLLATGSRAGLATVLATTDPQAAGSLTGPARVLVVQQLADPGLAGLIAPLTGTRPAAPSPAAAGSWPPGAAGAWPPATVAGGTAPVSAVAPPGPPQRPVVGAQTLCARPDDEFTLIAGLPVRLVVPLARAVQARIPEPRPVRPARLARLAGQQPPAAARLARVSRWWPPRPGEAP